MFSLIPNLIQTTMLRIYLGLVLVGLAVVVQTAKSEEGYFAPDLDILSIQTVRSDDGWLFPYRFNTSGVLALSEKTAHVGSGFGNTPQLHLVVEPKREALWPTDTRWRIASDSDHDRVSLSPLLRFESKGERIEIKPRRNSIWVVWRKAFP